MFPLPPVLLGSAKGQRRLHADSALESEPVAVAFLGGPGVHAVGGELQRLQDVDPHVDQPGHCVHDRTVRVVDYTHQYPPQSSPTWQ